MTKPKITDVVSKLVAMLTPLSSEERQRAISASLTLLGDSAADISRGSSGEADVDEPSSLPVRAKAWMKQAGVALQELQQVFHLADGAVDVIASDMPGKNDKEKTFNAYILTGAAQLLATGNPTFDDKTARAVCESAGCLNNANHSSYLKDHGNEFTGSKAKGWTLTAPGLKRAAALVKQLNGIEK